MPIVEGADPIETMNATLFASYLWRKFHVFKLTIIMRVMASNDRSQQSYVDATLALGKGQSHSTEAIIVSRKDQYTTTVALPSQQYMLHDETTATNSMRAAIKWLYPNSGTEAHPVHDPSLYPKHCIMAITNNQIDTWNSFVQSELNPNPPIVLTSHDEMTDVDDPNGYLKKTLSHAILTDFTKNDVPDHCLTLKINDIVLIMRPMKASGLASNSRVKILAISKKIIKVQQIEGIKKNIVLVPRMRFTFRLKNGKSFQLTRTQFPLRLAYAVTVNKSQGQTLGRVLEDATEEAFAHGQSYVARSRVTKRENIMLYINILKLMASPLDGVTMCPTITNVVYTEILKYV